MDPYIYHRKLQMVLTEPLHIVEVQYEHHQEGEKQNEKQKQRKKSDKINKGDDKLEEEKESTVLDRAELENDDTNQVLEPQSQTITRSFTPHSSSELLEKCFAPLRSARSLEEVFNQATIAFSRLRPLDTHQSAYLLLLPAHSTLSTSMESDIMDNAEGVTNRSHQSLGSTARSVPCIARIVLTEKKRLGFTAGVSHTTEQNETVFETQLVARNIFGNAEKLTANVMYSLTKSSAFQVQFSKPLLAWGWDKSADAQIFQQTVDNMKHSSHIEKRRGFRLRCAFGRHSLSYEWAWRRIQLGTRVTEGLLNEGEHNIKSSLIHQYFVDTRDDALTPTTGFAFRFAQEFAGLGGDVKFLKHEVGAQLNWPIGGTPGGAAVNVLLKGGTHVPLMGSPSRISDRFFLGGATSFRGFATKGMGPRFRRDSYGGDVFYFGAAHLTLPLPLSLPLRLNVGDFRTQLFAQIGNLLQIYSTSRPTQQQQQPHPQRMTMSNILDELKSTTRANVGIGLVWRTLFGMRVELNYTVPIWSQPNDQIKNLQIGVSFQFL